VANLFAGSRVLPVDTSHRKEFRMPQFKRSLATFAVVVGGALGVAAPAGAHHGFVVDGPITVQQGEAPKPFTPPIGSNKGS
jgi:hypothetical protein